MGAEISLIEWLVQQTGPVVGLVLALWWQQQNHRAYVEREKLNAEVHRQDKDRLITVLEQNTAAKTELVKTNTQLVYVNERLVETIGNLETALRMEKK